MATKTSATLWIPTSIIALAVLLAVPAHAELTPMEKEQIAAHVSEAKPEQAGRVRLLVGQPALNLDEAAEPLVLAYREVSFDARRAAFTEALLLGQGSKAARSTLFPAVVRALLARATRTMQTLPRQASGWDRKAHAAADELFNIHRFVANALVKGDAASAGRRGPSPAIRDDSMRAAALEYSRHLADHPSVLQHGKSVPPVLIRVRAQVQLTAMGLAGDAFSHRELAAWFGLSGIRRDFFLRSGVLVEDGGVAPPPRLEAALRLVDAAPIAKRGLSLLMLHKAPISGMAAHGRLASAPVVLGPVPTPVDARRFWSGDVDPSRPDAQMAEIAYTVGWLATRNAFERSPALRRRAHGAATRAQARGKTAFLAADLPRSVLDAGTGAVTQGVSAEQIIAAAASVLLLDAPRATTLALVRAKAGYRQPLEQLALALSVLAQESTDKKTMSLFTTEADGTLQPVKLTDLKTEGDMVTSFKLGKHRFNVLLGDDGKLASVRVNGLPPMIAELPYFRVRPVAASAWDFGGMEFTPLFGRPTAAVTDDGRFVVVGAADSGGFDAVATGETSGRFTIEAQLQPIGKGGGVLALANSGSSSYQAVGLLISAEPPQAMIAVVDGKGKAVQLGKAVGLAQPGEAGYQVSLRVIGKRVVAKVDGKTLRGVIRTQLPPGRAGITARAAGTLEVKSISVKSRW